MKPPPSNTESIRGGWCNCFRETQSHVQRAGERTPISHSVFQTHGEIVSVKLTGGGESSTAPPDRFCALKGCHNMRLP